MANLNLSKVEALRAAIRRLHPSHPKRSYLEKELHNTEAGLRGEARIQKKFIEYHSKEAHEIMWDVNLSLGKWQVQIDGLLLTNQVAIIIESKNISGELHFLNTTSEFFRIDSHGEKLVMDNPAIQTEKHVRFLEAWFNNHSINLPVDGLLVFTAKQSELITLPTSIHACRVHQMIEKLCKLIQHYPTPHSPKNSLQHLKHLIATNQTPFEPKPISIRYSINETEFSNGIYCYACNTPSVKRKQRSWRCLRCDLVSKDAALYTISEYYALIGGTVTNQKIRNFTGIDDRHVVKRLLSNKEFLKAGKKRHSSYALE